MGMVKFQEKRVWSFPRKMGVADGSQDYIQNMGNALVPQEYKIYYYLDIVFCLKLWQSME